MKLLDYLCVPAISKTHVTINLQEVSLTLIELLVYVSGIECILCLGVLDRSHQNCRRFWQFHCSVYRFFGFFKMFLIPLLIYIDLVVNDDSQSFRVICFVDHIIDSMRQL